MSYKEKSFFRSYCCTMIQKGNQFYNVETNLFVDYDTATQFYCKDFAVAIRDGLPYGDEMNLVEFRIEFHYVGIINNE